ncbi:MAG: hypothetical protein FWF44_11185 [Defluviitaleaceae bacterium]|nr:hypothetical protein [Defluviitaleaceae bacterium]
MSKLSGVRVVEIPPFKAVTSGPDTFGHIFAKGGFGDWPGGHGSLIKNIAPYESPDFMWHEQDDVNKSVWIWAVYDWVTEADTAPYKLIDYEGGIFVAATADENDGGDINEVVGGMLEWIAAHDCFERDERPGHRGMGHRIGCGRIQQALGMAQQEIFLPVKLKN